VRGTPSMMNVTVGMVLFFARLKPCARYR
jgi:hypothetical protein